MDHLLQLWWASLEDFDGSYADLSAQLPVEEQKRASRIRIAAARHRFILARNILRRCLGAFLGVDPTTLDIVAGHRGKPYLSPIAIGDPPQFNLSHSGDVVSVAIASVDVGIDVESLREVANAEKLARRFFSANERSAIDLLDGEARDRTFLRIWTQKEAYLKATGLGVGMPLREVETEPDPDASPRLLAISGDRNEAARWILLEVEIPGAVCTVAVRGSKPRLKAIRINPADF
jgi:4'-phosphopantetheinyl transferase